MSWPRSINLPNTFHVHLACVFRKSPCTVSYITHSPLNYSSSLPSFISNLSSKLRATSVQSCSSLRCKLSEVISVNWPGHKLYRRNLTHLICTLMSSDWLTYFPQLFISILRQSTTEDGILIISALNRMFSALHMGEDVIRRFHTWSRNFLPGCVTSSRLNTSLTISVT